MQLAASEARDSGAWAPAGRGARLGLDSDLSKMLWGSGPAPFQTRGSLGKSFFWDDGGIWKKQPGVSHRLMFMWFKANKERQSLF